MSEFFGVFLESVCLGPPLFVNGKDYVSIDLMFFQATVWLLGLNIPYMKPSQPKIYPLVIELGNGNHLSWLLVSID